MEGNGTSVGIFMMPIPESCGPSCSCCGPVGQSEQAIQGLKTAIEQEFGCQVAVYNVTDGQEMKAHLPIVRLVRSFGMMALPMITLNDEVVSMGSPVPEDVVAAVREKMNQERGANYANV